MTYQAEYEGEWSEGSCGGCVNNLSWRDNPQIFLKLSAKTKLNVTLSQVVPKGKEPFGIGFYIANSDGSGRKQILLTRKDLVAKSEFEDSPQVTAELMLEAVEHPYVFIPCTFYPDEKTKFTVTITGDQAFSITPVMAGWQCFSVSGEWTKETAGGCRNHPTHLNNPQYLITASTDTRVKVQVIQSQKDFDQLGVYLLRTQESQAKLVRSDVDDIVSKSDFISSEEAHLDAVLQPEARYAILPCTFDPAHEGKFEIRVYSDNDVYIEELAPLPSVTIKGAWESDTAGGCVNHLSWRDNPQFFLEVKEKCALTLRLTQHEQERRSIGFYVVLSDGIKKLVLEPADIIAKAAFQNTRDVTCDVTLEPRDMPYIIIPATFRPHEYGKFSISIFGQHGFNPSGSVALFPCREKWYSVSVKGEWKGNTAGGCRNHATCSNNPQYLLTANSTRKVVILLSQDKLNSQSIGCYVCKRNDEKGKTKRLAKVLKKHVIAKAYPFRNDREVDCSFECQQDIPYYIIPCTFEPGCERSFELTAYFDVEGGCSLQAI